MMPCKILEIAFHSLHPMKTFCRSHFIVSLLCSLGFLQSGLGGEVSVRGGTLPDSAGLGPLRVPSFLMSRFQTTREEWQWVQAWAVQNGYDIRSTETRNMENFPVRNVSWYDAVKWCNAKSQMKGLSPAYTVSGATYKRGYFVPVLNEGSNGYRLPNLAEWVWAARGGAQSKGYCRNASDQIEDAAWYDRNIFSPDRKFVTKVPNALGLYDMSGYNASGKVGEWCWDFGAPQYSTRRIRYGNWWNPVAVGRAISYPIYNFPDHRSHGLGFRTVRQIH